MISGIITFSKTAPDFRAQSLFHSPLSSAISSQVIKFDDSTITIVYEKKLDDTPINIQQPPKNVEDVRRALHHWPLQAIMIALIHRNGNNEMIIERNHQAFCPIYFIHQKENVHFHWDPTALYQFLDKENFLDRTQCEAFLNLRWNYGANTVFKKIKMIPERAKVVFRIKNHDFILPPSIAAIEPVALEHQSDPIEVFQKMLIEAISWWNPEPETTYCEQSSGLDTTLVSLLTKNVMSFPPKTFGYYPHDKNIDQIIHRREEAVRAIESEDICPSIENYFDSAFLSDEDIKFWPYQAPTAFEKNVIGSSIALQKGRIVFSGIGGDELCQLSERERFDARQKFNAHHEDFQFFATSIVHENLEKDSIEELPIWPTGYVPESSHDVANSIAPTYLKHNIWYAHPLALGHIQTFAHFLPVEWRKNRRLSRDILTRLGLSSNFTTQIPKESVGLSVDKILMDDDIFIRLFKNSILADEKLIDMNKLIHLRNILKQKPGMTEASGNILTAYMLERSLKSF